VLGTADGCEVGTAVGSSEGHDVNRNASGSIKQAVLVKMCSSRVEGVTVTSSTESAASIENGATLLLMADTDDKISTVSD
jgi:hypothetical protein